MHLFGILKGYIGYYKKILGNIIEINYTQNTV